MMAWRVTPMRVPNVVLLSWKNEPVDCEDFHTHTHQKRRNSLSASVCVHHCIVCSNYIVKKNYLKMKEIEGVKLINSCKRLYLYTSVSRSEEEREELVGEEGGGAGSFAGSNITFCACNCVRNGVGVRMCVECVKLVL